MGVITAMFLSYMPADDAFYMLATLVEQEPFELGGLFERSMRKSKVMIKAYDILLPQFYKKFHAHMVRALSLSCPCFFVFLSVNICTNHFFNELLCFSY